MRLHYRFDHHPKPIDPKQYIRCGEVDVLVSNLDDEQVTAGRLEVDHLDIARAEAAGQRIIDVCDSDSSEWEYVYSSVIEPAHDFSEIRRDFGFDSPVNHLVYIRGTVFHPSLREWQNFIIDSVCRLLSKDSAIVMLKGETDLTLKELADLGFRMVAGSELLFRPNMLENPYSIIKDERDSLDLKVSADVEEFVELEWEKLSERD